MCGVLCSSISPFLGFDILDLAVLVIGGLQSISVMFSEISYVKLFLGVSKWFENCQKGTNFAFASPVDL